MKKNTPFHFLYLLLSILGFNSFAQTKPIQIDSISSAFTIVDLHNGGVNGVSVKMFAIDLDQNNVPDLTFTSSYQMGSGSVEASASVQAGDSCFISITKKGKWFVTQYNDTILKRFATIAKILNPGDTVYSDSCIAGAGVNLASFSNPAPGTYKSYINEWISGIHHIGIKKIIHNKEYLGWIKLDVHSYTDVILKEYVIQTLPVGIDEIKKTSAIVYPNPVQDQLFIKDAHCEKVEIMTINGIVISSQENRNNDLTFSVDVRSLAPGIYFLKMKEANKEWYSVQKLVKQ